jgi:hypothetical protein
MFRLLTPLVTAAVLLGATDLPAQQRTLGLNFRVTGTTQVGVTWFASPSVALRPSIEAQWIKTTSPSPFVGDNETLQWSLNLEALFGASGPERLNVYTGLGASIGGINPGPAPSSTVWGAWGLLGVSFRVVDRVAVFGEIGLTYEDAKDVVQRFGLGTFPLGIVVYLK